MVGADRQAGFFSFDLDTRHYCMITIPAAAGATRPAQSGVIDAI
jgi:hypothetical protein